MDARGALDILDLTLLDRGASESDLDELCTLANLHRPASVCVSQSMSRMWQKDSMMLPSVLCCRLPSRERCPRRGRSFNQTSDRCRS